ncbi:MAG: LysE family transporter [Hyphomicrobiaceae bacterium]|nr:LysE family transporter [Hyphomicrobiaceae bacterium]
MGFMPNPLIIPVGLVIGILIALPTGPINLLALQRAAERGFFGGLAAGIGIMLGDGLIALAAAMGVNAVSGALRLYRSAIQIIGGLALVGAGAKLYFTRTSFASVHDAAGTTLADYAWDIPKHLFLTITNPGAVLSLIAILGGASTFVEVASHVDAIALTLAVMGGSFIYWLVASHLINRVRHRLDETRMGHINKVAGLLLIAVGCVLIGEMVIKAMGWRGAF